MRLPVCSPRAAPCTMSAAPSRVLKPEERVAAGLCLAPSGASCSDSLPVRENLMLGAYLRYRVEIGFDVAVPPPVA